MYSASPVILPAIPSCKALIPFCSGSPGSSCIPRLSFFSERLYALSFFCFSPFSAVMPFSVFFSLKFSGFSPAPSDPYSFGSFISSCQLFSVFPPASLSSRSAGFSVRLHPHSAAITAPSAHQSRSLLTIGPIICLPLWWLWPQKLVIIGFHHPIINLSVSVCFSSHIFLHIPICRDNIGRPRI